MILFILQATGLGPVHGYIMGMIMSYLVFGITCKKKGRRIILALGLGCGMLGTFSALDWRFETALVLICAIAAAVVSPSIGSRKRDRLLGRIVEVGMGLHHKYRGVAVAEIKAPSGFYLCPLSRLAPNPSMKCRGSLEIAFRTGEPPCAVTLYWHEYGGCTVVSGERG